MLPGQLTGAWLAKIYLIFYGIRGLISALTSGHFLSLPEQSFSSSPRHFEIFRDIISLYSEKSLGLRQTLMLEDHPLSHVLYWLFSVGYSQLLETVPPSANRGRALVWWQGRTHIQKIYNNGGRACAQITFSTLCILIYICLYTVLSQGLECCDCLTKNKDNEYKKQGFCGIAIGLICDIARSINMLMIGFTILMIILWIHNIMSWFPVTEKLVIFIYLVLLKCLVEHLSLDESSKHLETCLDINCCVYFKSCNTGCMAWM